MIQPAQDKGRWRILYEHGNENSEFYSAMNFWTSWATISFLRKTKIKTSSLLAA